MSIRRTFSIVATVATLVAHPLLADEPYDSDEVSQLLAIVKQQQETIEELRQRIEDLERFKAELEAAGGPVAFEPTITIDELATLSDEIDEVRESVSLIPDITGYFDFHYSNDDRANSPGGFHQHHLAIILSKDYQDFRFLSEIEFNHGAAFGVDIEGELEEARGAIELERAWGEYSNSDLLTVRGGLMLTPGYWNVNHYANVILSTGNPLMVGHVFPKLFTGVMAYGRRYSGRNTFYYDTYLANGVSENFVEVDDNENMAVGGGLGISIPIGNVLDTFDVKVSGYAEESDQEGEVRTYGVETQIRKRSFELLAEYAQRRTGAERIGLYVQPSYRFGEDWALFYRFDLLEERDVKKTQQHTLGLTYWPISAVSLKLEGFHAEIDDDDGFNGMTVSAAFAF